MDELKMKLASALGWCVKHESECLGDHPALLAKFRGLLHEELDEQLGDAAVKFLDMASDQARRR